MKLLRLHVKNFAAVRDVAIDFGPGLNVLYGPNDLGKSTLVDAIRLALLLPHASNHGEAYVPWSGGAAPFVELSFETEAQRIWRVRKEFGKGGLSELETSRNGRDFEDAERGRKVDGKLRQILGWGIPEPGGSGSGRGFPKSFLSTVLLSTQADVTAVLSESLEGDQADSGKERIAAALQAVAQDPLFVALLRNTQAKRDEAYTEKGAKKQARGSIFKVGAERVNTARDEMERIQRVVTESEGAEGLVRDLSGRRDRRQETLTETLAKADIIETLAKQAADCAAAAEDVRVAREEVLRIEKMDADVATSEQQVGELARQSGEAQPAVESARALQGNAEAALKAAEDSVREEQADPGIGDTVVRQELELRKITAQQAVADAERRILSINEAQALVDNASKQLSDRDTQQKQEETCLTSLSQAEGQKKSFFDALGLCDRLERLLESVAAETQLAEAESAVQKQRELQSRRESAQEKWSRLGEQRGLLTIPGPQTLLTIRRLDAEVAAARAALNLGLVVTLKPDRRLDVQIQRDGASPESTSVTEPFEIEADTAIEVVVPGVVTFGVAAGRRDARAQARIQEERWNGEVLPHFTAAGVANLEALEAAVERARELDDRIMEQATLIESLDAQLVPLGNAGESCALAVERAKASRVAADEASELHNDLEHLGSDPLRGLSARRTALRADLEAAQTKASEAATAHTIAVERSRQFQSALEASISARDTALLAFTEGLTAALTATKAALAASVHEVEVVAAQLAALDRSGEDRRNRIDAALKGAREAAIRATLAAETAQGHLTATLTSHAVEVGRLGALRTQREAESLELAQGRLRERTDRLAALPAPEKTVTSEDVIAARNAVAALNLEVESIEREIQRAHGALEQVGGSVARERLRDATEAFELAERLERETEAEYEAWLLLLEQMKAADAAQASNLGQVFVPAVTEGFRSLTRQRYEGVQLTADLGTEGVVVNGTVHSQDCLSVGTREQLSTLYRIALAEYLGTAMVLDDQLVQSDGKRMEWFRQLLTEKARSFQIVVFTCRPTDYLGKGALVPAKGAIHLDSNGKLTRAIDLGRALGPGSR